MSTITETLQAGLEQVSDIVRSYKDADQGLLRHFKPSKVAVPSRQLYRVPYFRSHGGVQAKSNMDGGVIAGGTGPIIDSFKAGWIDNVLTFEVTQEQIDLSRTSEQSRVNIVSDILANAIMTCLDHDNIDLLGDGSGKLTNAAGSSPSSTTLLFNATGDQLRTNRLFRGRAVDVWDATGATLRAGGPYIIASVNHTTGLVTFTAAPTGLAGTDLLAVANLDEYGPSTLVTRSSTWPGDATTNGPGLTGDSWRHGIQYPNDDTTTGYYLGKLKSTYPELVPVGKDLETELLTYAHAELIKSLMIQTRDESIVNGVMAVMHTAQQSQLKTEVQVISRWNREGDSQKAPNLVPGGTYNDTFSWGEFTAFAVKGMARDRVDLFQPSEWGTVEGEPTDWYRSPEGGSMFERKRNGDGARLNAYELSLKQKFDFVSHDPGSGAWLYNIGVPAGF